MEKIKVVYKPCTEIEFEAPDGAYNDITRLLFSEKPPKVISSLDGSIYKFCLSLEDIAFISLEREDKTEDRAKVGFGE